jgi:hypothetical protein
MVRWDGKREIKTAEERVYTLSCAYLSSSDIVNRLDPSPYAQHFCTFPTPFQTFAPCDTCAVAVSALERYSEVDGLLHDFGLETDGDSTPYTVLYSSK